MKNILTTLCLLLGVHLNGAAQGTLTLDLAKEAGGSLTLPISEGDHIITIKNRLPGKNYDIKVEIEDIELAPIQLPASQKASVASDCPRATALIGEIEALDDEALLPPMREELETLFASLASTCPVYGSP